MGNRGPKLGSKQKRAEEFNKEVFDTWCAVKNDYAEMYKKSGLIMDLKELTIFEETAKRLNCSSNTIRIYMYKHFKSLESSTKS